MINNVIAMVCGLVTVRLKPVLWALLAVGVAGVLWFGNADAGFYAGYEAGSLFDPERYEDTWWTSRHGDSNGLRAAQLNEEVAALRNQYLPGLVVLAGVLVGGVLLSFFVGTGYSANALEMAVKLDEDDELKRFFVSAYEADRGAYKEPPLVGSLMPARLGSYAVEYMGQPGADGGIAGTPVTRGLVSEVRGRLGDARGRVFLGFDGLKLDGAGHVVPLLEGLPIRLPVVRASARPRVAAPAGPARKTCPSCGASLPATARFCAKCGAPQGTA